MSDNMLLEPVYGQGAHADPVACVEDIAAALAARTVWPWMLPTVVSAGV